MWVVVTVLTSVLVRVRVVESSVEGARCWGGLSSVRGREWEVCVSGRIEVFGVSGDGAMVGLVVVVMVLRLNCDGMFGNSGSGSGCGGGECLRLELWWSENAEVVAVRLMVRTSGLMIAGLDVEGMELDVWSSLVWGLG